MEKFANLYNLILTVVRTIVRIQLMVEEMVNFFLITVFSIGFATRSHISDYFVSKKK